MRGVSWSAASPGAKRSGRPDIGAFQR